MSIFGIVIIAFALAMISFSVAYLSSFFRCQNLPGMLRTAFSLAVFQGAMFGLGYLIAIALRGLLSQFSWPIVIIILMALGFKMILISRKAKPTERAFDFSHLRLLIGVSFASGINAFLVGLALGIISMDLIPALPIVAGASFCLSIIGLILGRTSGNMRYSKLAEFIGGLMVILTGLLLFVEYLQLI